MKCINKLLVLIIMASFLSACNSADLWMPFSTYVDFKNDFSDDVLNIDNNIINGFSNKFAVSKDDITDFFSLKDSQFGILVKINTNEVLFQQGAYESIYPASITKILTAYTVLKYANLDDVITCTDEVNNIYFDDAVLLGLEPGDRLTVDEAMHYLLISSYNDVAISLACHVSGSEEAFAELMNEEAEKLGATHTHFTNSHGLPDENHYTCVHDLYIIFNELIKNEYIQDIIGTKNYSATYYNAANEEITRSGKSTNKYFFGKYTLPEEVEIIGGKTGTTDDAGHCLLLYSKDNLDNTYISVIIKADTKDELYEEMTDLLNSVTKY